MNLSQEQLRQIENFASIYFKISDIAIMLGLNEHELRKEINNPLSEAAMYYRRGKLTTKAKLASQEMQLALMGAPQAIENANRALLDMEDDE